jgi:hypothetical protein
MPPEAALIAGGERLPLACDSSTTVPAGTLIVEVTGVPETAEIRLDGQRVSSSYEATAGRASFAHNLQRATGAHELRVDETVFLFETEDAKLKIDGMLRLLEYLREHGLSWNGTMFFSGRSEVLRDPRLDWQWLQRTAPETLKLTAAIIKDPASARTSRQRRATHGVPAIGATFRLLRQRPDLLEEIEGGPIVAQNALGEDVAYAPHEIIVRERRRVLDTPGNRRATALLEGTRQLAIRLVGANPGKEIVAELEHIAEQASARLHHEPFRSLLRRRAYTRLARRLGVEERIDHRYRRVLALHEELFDDRHWDPQREVLPERAYAGLADQIFQRFCAHLLADHLGLALAPQGLRGNGPHFESDEWRVWVDVAPPNHILLDWRDSSERPARLRPDIVVLHRPSGRVALLDAKYRATGARATLDSLSEVQLYLQAYGRATVGVLFPPVVGSAAALSVAKVHDALHDKYTIFAIPFLPDARTADLLASDAMSRTLEALLEP